MSTKSVKKRTHFFKSRSDRRTKYKVERHRNGKVTCTCPGFMYQAVGPKGAHCWHTEQAKGWLK